MSAAKKMPGLLAIIGHPEESEKEGGSDDPAYEAMDEFIAAVHDKDCARALKAFRVLHDVHSADDGGGDEKDDERGEY